jgi:rare lipoprotein A
LEGDDDPPDMRRIGAHLFVCAGIRETCVASHYGYGGGQTASGERMKPNAMTAAHRARPFGSHVTVTSHSTGRSVTVRINDRGPL